MCRPSYTPILTGKIIVMYVLVLCYCSQQEHKIFHSEFILSLILSLNVLFVFLSTSGRHIVNWRQYCAMLQRGVLVFDFYHTSEPQKYGWALFLSPLWCKFVLIVDVNYCRLWRDVRRKWYPCLLKNWYRRLEQCKVSWFVSVSTSLQFLSARTFHGVGSWK